MGNRLIVLDSVNKHDYIVVRSNGKLHITVAVEKEPNFIDAICTIIGREDLKILLDWWSLPISSTKKISFTPIEGDINIEAMEDGRMLSVLIAEEEFKKLYAFI